MSKCELPEDTELMGTFGGVSCTEIEGDKRINLKLRFKQVHLLSVLVVSDFLNKFKMFSFFQHHGFVKNYYTDIL